jgi:hypothetical protein
MLTVRCHIYKNWASDNGYVDVISPTGTIARMYKHAYYALDKVVRGPICALLVELIVAENRRMNVVLHNTYIMEYDIDLTIDEMKQVAESPITELFETIDELPKFGKPKTVTV